MALCSRTTDPDEALGSFLDHRNQHDFQWQYGLQTTTWVQAAAQMMDFHMILGVTWAKDINRDSSCSGALDPVPSMLYLLTLCILTLGWPDAPCTLGWKDEAESVLASQVWLEERGEQEHGLYSLHCMFDIVGTHLTHRDVRVLSFLLVDVIDDHERGLIRNGRDFLLALERHGRCEQSNFRQVLQLLRIITRHDLLPYVTLKKRRAVCPDLVDKYLEETSVRYVTPRALSDPEPRPPHYPVVCCPTSCSQMCSKRPAQGRTTLGSQRKRRKSVTPDPEEKQTCDIRLRVRAEYCLHETALQGNVFSNKQDPLELVFL
uniref:death effector domain-containing protein-like n=1 Tax=Arvicanthis niloticus TaxID=61156 RepID=UPI001486AB43|nr:death effector domain-containing protein-like [Arvicanthis niloticus]